MGTYFFPLYFTPTTLYYYEKKNFFLYNTCSIALAYIYKIYKVLRHAAVIKS